MAYTKPPVKPKGSSYAKDMMEAALAESRAQKASGKPSAGGYLKALLAAGMSGKKKPTVATLGPLQGTKGSTTTPSAPRAILASQSKAKAPVKATAKPKAKAPVARAAPKVPLTGLSKFTGKPSASRLQTLRKGKR